MKSLFPLVLFETGSKARAAMFNFLSSYTENIGKRREYKEERGMKRNKNEKKWERERKREEQGEEGL